MQMLLQNTHHTILESITKSTPFVTTPPSEHTFKFYVYIQNVSVCNSGMHKCLQKSRRHFKILVATMYRVAYMSLDRPTSRCILFDSKNISLYASPVIYRVTQEECARLREGVPYVKVHRYNPKHLCPKLNGYGDNGQRKVWSSGGSTQCTCQLTYLSMSVLECGVILRQFSCKAGTVF